MSKDKARIDDFGVPESPLIPDLPVVTYGAEGETVEFDPEDPLFKVEAGESDEDDVPESEEEEDDDPEPPDYSDLPPAEPFSDLEGVDEDDD